jgi:hypothetical protein
MKTWNFSTSFFNYYWTWGKKARKIGVVTGHGRQNPIDLG